MIFADYPVQQAAVDLVGTAFLNSGQDCTAPCRVLVEDTVYDDFVEAFEKEVRQLVQGDPEDETTYVGPVISEAHLERVSGFVERARSAGARVLVGGARLDCAGWFYQPTVITDVPQDAEIVQKEVFGPVVTIQRASSDGEMLQMANGVEQGLAASIWTKDLDRAMRLTRDLAFGTVWVNQHLVLANEMPFGGFGQSGYGKELSAHAIDEYSQFKHVMIKTLDE
jgi:acyl-CoA reductase-like NAD-dependent aldehyde dehydrogenase